MQQAASSSWQDAGFRSLFLLLSGAALETDVGTFALTTSGGSTVVTFPFTPDLVLVIGADAGGVAGVQSIGAIDASGSQWAFSISVPYIGLDGSGIGTSWQSNAHLCISGFVHGFLGDTFAAATGAITTNTLTVTQDAGADHYPVFQTMTYTYLAIRDPDGEFSVGYGTMSTGESGLSSEPDAVLVATTWQPPTSASPQDYPGCLSLGYFATDTIDAAPQQAATYCPTIPRLEAGGQGPGKRFRSQTSAYSLISTDHDNTIQNTLEIAPDATGFSTTATDPSAEYGWVTMRVDGASRCQLGGIFWSVGVVGSDAADELFDGSDVNGQGVSTMSIGVVGPDSVTQHAIGYGSSFGGVFSDAYSSLVSALGSLGKGRFVNDTFLVADGCQAGAPQIIRHR